MPENLSRDLRRLDMLSDIAQAAHLIPSETGLDAQGFVLEKTGPASSLRRLIRTLEVAGLVTVHPAGTGGWSSHQTTQGRQLWAQLAAARTDPRARSRKLRDVYLRWIVGHDNSDATHSPEQFLVTGPTYMGTPYTATELQLAGEYLFDHGFIKAQDSERGDGLLRPASTKKGRGMIDRNVSVSQVG